MKRNLLALSSAAVLAVYSAGYERTKEAAERFANETEHRRRPPAPPPEESAPVATAKVVSAPTTKTAPVKKKAKAKPAEPTKVANAPTQDSTKPTVSAPAVVPVESPAPAPAPAVPPPNAPVAVAAPVDTATKATLTDSAQAKPKWKDGVYAAWGQSRHGDMEVSVQIMKGRIVDAWISQCWTQYPCSRIAKLPPQVVARQSENVDVVSGATQSADAFYYGAMQALIKAKP